MTRRRVDITITVGQVGMHTRASDEIGIVYYVYYKEGSINDLLHGTRSTLISLKWLKEGAELEAKMRKGMQTNEC